MDSSTPAASDGLLLRGHKFLPSVVLCSAILVSLFICWHILESSGYKPLPVFTGHFEKILALSSLIIGLICSLLLWQYTRLLQRHHNAIEEKQLRLESILNGTLAGTWEWNIQTGETVFNERWAQIVGYTLAELSPVSVETWASLTHPDDLETSKEQLMLHLKDPSLHYHIDARMKHKNGHWVWISTRGSVTTWSKDGSPLIMQGIHIDISDRKKAEKDLQDAFEDLKMANSAIADQNLRLENVIKGTDAGTWEWDIQTGAATINERVAEMIGYTVAELTPVSIEKFWNFMHPDDQAGGMELLNEFFKTAVADRHF